MCKILTCTNHKPPRDLVVCEDCNEHTVLQSLASKSFWKQKHMNKYTYINANLIISYIRCTHCMFVFYCVLYCLVYSCVFAWSPGTADAIQQHFYQYFPLRFNSLAVICTHLPLSVKQLELFYIQHRWGLLVQHLFSVRDRFNSAQEGGTPCCGFRLASSHVI